MLISFGEYLGANGVELEDGWIYGKQKNTVQQKLADYHTLQEIQQGRRRATIVLLQP